MLGPSHEVHIQGTNCVKGA